MGRIGRMGWQADRNNEEWKAQPRLVGQSPLLPVARATEGRLQAVGGGLREESIEEGTLDPSSCWVVVGLLYCHLDDFGFNFFGL